MLHLSKIVDLGNDSNLDELSPKYSSQHDESDENNSQKSKIVDNPSESLFSAVSNKNALGNAHLTLSQKSNSDEIVEGCEGYEKV